MTGYRMESRVDFKRLVNEQKNIATVESMSSRI